MMNNFRQGRRSSELIVEQRLGARVGALTYIIYRREDMSGEAWLEVEPGYMPRTELTNITIQGVWTGREKEFSEVHTTP